MLTSYPIAQARDHLPRLIHDAEKGSTIELTRRGRPVAVLISASRYRRLVKDKPAFWSALQRFRHETKLTGLGLGPRTFRKLRDRSPGRDTAW